MKLTNIATLLFMLCVIVACNTTSKTEAEKPTEGKKASMEGILKDGSCFEQRMEKWFITFNQFQNEGFDMIAANEKAIGAVESEFKICMAKDSGLANDETSADQ
ncbi:hypothetical protein [Chryseosolibacter indicus]|uniref:Lipoprotein n=1 Tax=Chryseosolibacter indicus TaxID=2782351 RepID=A0ABS5VL85_9BACT|nr:hypothetical protein [Chryseosolibacter indicus]MBT1702213.1 hypothetical protein [Chryseosolibacter indicus]